MQALILAAGAGTRLGVYTEENTKCMLEINGKTLIEHALDKLNNLGLTKLILVVGYKKENLISHLGKKYKNISIEYVENPIYHKTNNIYSLFLARDKLEQDDTILIESDLIFDEGIILKLMNDERKSLAVIDKYQSWMDGTAVEIDKKDNIINFLNKKLFRFQDVDRYYKTVNIYKFSKEFSKKTYIPFLEAYSKAKGDNEYYESVLRFVFMIENQELKALRLNGELWYEIDDPQDKSNAEIVFAKDGKSKLNFLQERYGGYWRFPKLKDFCYLVNPYFPPNKMQEEIKAYFYNLLSQYPSGQNTQNLLAGKMFTIDPKNILVANGASEIIRGIGDVLDGTFGMAFPTFNEYPESINYNRIVKFMPKNNSFSYTIEDLKELSNVSDNLVIINPDNPSGNFITKEEMINLIKYTKLQNKTIVIDESFVDFASNGERETLIDQDIINKYNNLIVIKSISKSYGVPGIRLGVLVSSNIDIIKKFKKELTIWNINSFGEFFLQIMCKYKQDYNESCELIRLERDRFYLELKKVPCLEVYPTSANYFLCEVVGGMTANYLAHKLVEDYDIFIKVLSGKIGFENRESIRISVRDFNDNNYLISALVEIHD